MGRHSQKQEACTVIRQPPVTQSCQTHNYAEFVQLTLKENVLLETKIVFVSSCKHVYVYAIKLDIKHEGLWGLICSEAQPLEATV